MLPWVKLHGEYTFGLVAFSPASQRFRRGPTDRAEEIAEASRLARKAMSLGKEYPYDM
jgi:hypothetical protein